MARRGQGEGSIFRRADGRWAAQITLEGGQRKSFYGKTRQEVAAKLREAHRHVEQGLPIVAERQTVAQFLAEWLETRRAELVHETWLRYEQCVRLHINPEVGHIRLARLTAQQVQRLYAVCLADGLSTTTTRHVHAVLHRALESAVRLGLVARNVADMVDAPRRRRVDIHPLTRDESQRLLRAAEGDRLEALFVLALATGMREGELLALRWRDIDLERLERPERSEHGAAGRLSVMATLKRRDGQAVWAEPKSKRSRRQISLSTPVVEALRRHRQRQRLERLAAGAAWQEWQELGLVFVDEIGMPLTDWHIRYLFWRLLREAGVPKVRFHDLRHTCATLLLSQGINPKIVSEMLGHSSIAITLDIYSHVLPDMQQDAAAALAVALGWR